MNHQEEQELLSQSTLPVLSRLDRLDRLVSDFFFSTLLFVCACVSRSRNLAQWFLIKIIRLASSIHLE